VLHLGFPRLVVAEGIAGVSKGSRNMATPGLPRLCGEGKQTMEVRRVIRHSTPVMHYESKHNPLLSTLDDACESNIDGDKVFILWESSFLLAQNV
jgi:hypothetical protein